MGIGAAHLRGFAAEGGQVVFGDVAEEAGWERIVVTAEEEFGPVSVPVNNAAILPPFLPIDGVDAADWRRVLEVNLTGSFFGIEFVTPSMRRAGGGSIERRGLRSFVTGAEYLVDGGAVTGTVAVIDPT
jgi:3alpha(or 20beta)-hydroxysteroid dehydrogenase